MDKVGQMVIIKYQIIIDLKKGWGVPVVAAPGFAPSALRIKTHE
jgi:hypothetical protein